MFLFGCYGRFLLQEKSAEREPSSDVRMQSTAQAGGQQEIHASPDRGERT